jgi:trypsin
VAPNVVRHSDFMKFREYYNLSDAHIIMFNSVKNNKQVLSSAHCFGVSDVVTIGMHKINLGTGEAAKFYNIEHIPIAESVVHPKYNADTLDNDFWMIRLQWASNFVSENVAQRDTPTDSLVLASISGADLVVIRFGTLTSGGVTPNVMQEVIVDYVSNAACVSQPYGYSSSDITSSMMCAG